MLDYERAFPGRNDSWMIIEFVKYDCGHVKLVVHPDVPSGYDPFKCIRYLIFTDFLEVTPGCKNSCFIHQILQTPFQIPFQPLYNNPPIKIVLSTIVLVKPMPEIEQAAAAESTVLFEKYEVERLLGCGAFAKVYHARNTSTGQSVAVKAEDYVYWAST
ncbi:hypothetical protein LR48_Vigan10g006400 [Vigna angularis]|uniref:Protein kinase domain-containing protein n=1 Tax=Phaseolus angularis TaxID=3914 RepID=A0A0L9VGX7_PHAAN|nr:hypothetical protein LR48_Vigan10g006400 [Vigna angularis]